MRLDRRFLFSRVDVSAILKNKEDTVLNAWHHRKKIIDEYLQYISFKRNTDKVFVWIDEHDECFVSKLEELDINDEGYMDFVRALKVCLHKSVNTYWLKKKTIAWQTVSLTDERWCWFYEDAKRFNFVE